MHQDIEAAQITRDENYRILCLTIEREELGKLRVSRVIDVPMNSVGQCFVELTNGIEQAPVGHFGQTTVKESEERLAIDTANL